MKNFVGFNDGFRNRVAEKVTLRHEPSNQQQEGNQASHNAHNSLEQNVPTEIKEFLYVEFSHGRPCERLLYAFVHNPKVNKKVLALYTAKQQRLKWLIKS
jgi:hypothetical protein